eukprot:445356_1
MSIPTAKIEIFVSGFIAYHSHNHQSQDIVKFVILHLNGNEGTTPIVVDDDDQMGMINIATEHKTGKKLTYSLMDLVAVQQYFLEEKPSRKEFCMKMKENFGSTFGASIKAYKYVLTTSKHIEGLQTDDEIE